MYAIGIVIYSRCFVSCKLYVILLLYSMFLLGLFFSFKTMHPTRRSTRIQRPAHPMAPGSVLLRRRGPTSAVSQVRMVLPSWLPLGQKKICGFSVSSYKNLGRVGRF